jgi:hypothetical protein
MATVKHPTPWKFLIVGGFVVAFWLSWVGFVLFSVVHFVVKNW